MSDGTAGLPAIADAAREMGLSYVGVCDHSKSAYYAGGLKADDVRRQWAAIDAFNAEHPEFRFFKGIESDILTDGSLDYDEELLAGFDFVVASVHSGFTMSRTDMEARIIRAMENPYTTILGHPTGRLLLARDGYQVDMGRIIEAAAARHVMIELNASPYRLDIDWRHLRGGKGAGRHDRHRPGRPFRGRARRAFLWRRHCEEGLAGGLRRRQYARRRGNQRPLLWR